MAVRGTDLGLVAGSRGIRMAHLPALERRRATGIASVVVGMSAGLLFRLAVGSPDCGAGLVRTPVDFALPVIASAIATGAVYAFSLSEATAHAVAGHRLRALVVGPAAQLALLLIVPALLFATSYGACALP